MIMGSVLIASIAVVLRSDMQIRPVSYHFLDVLFKKLFVIQLFSYSARAIETILNLRILMRDDKSVMPKKSEKNFNEKLLF